MLFGALFFDRIKGVRNVPDTMLNPVISPGSRSGVHWTRAKRPPTAFATALASVDTDQQNRAKFDRERGAIWANGYGPVRNGQIEREQPYSGSAAHFSKDLTASVTDSVSKPTGPEETKTILPFL